MVDYEKGNPSWDIGQIMTRHHTACDRRVSLRATAVSNQPSHVRHMMALNKDCTCGAGDSDSERTSLKKGANLAGATVTARDAEQQAAN